MNGRFREDIEEVDSSYQNPLYPPRDEMLTGNPRTDLAIKSSLAGFDLSIDQTWDGQPLDHSPITLHMEWIFERQNGRPHKRAIKCFMQVTSLKDPQENECVGGFFWIRNCIGSVIRMFT